MTIYDKKFFLLNVILIHLTPLVFFLVILITPSRLDIPILASCMFWVSMFAALFRTEQNRHRISLWCITSLLSSFILLSPGMLTFIAWSIKGFAP